jgi:hypothetical protein
VCCVLCVLCVLCVFSYTFGKMLVMISLSLVNVLFLNTTGLVYPGELCSPKASTLR